MNGKQKTSIVVASIIVVSLAATCVTASSQTSNTPLYTFRMEEVSSEMNFLSTEVSEITYNTQNGYTLNYEFGPGMDNAYFPFWTRWGPTCRRCTMWWGSCPTGDYLPCDPECTWWRYPCDTWLTWLRD
jgi:hypothetical protein